MTTEPINFQDKHSVDRTKSLRTVSAETSDIIRLIQEFSYSAASRLELKTSNYYVSIKK